jgi:glutamyl-tRNA synthetase
MRGRFAPSPTGELHLGNARTALLAWLQVRSAGGAMVMRVEDLDRARVVPGAAERQLASLRALGLDWDEGPDVGGPFAPYVQSERLDHYQRAFAQLDAAGLLYPCFCSRAEIARSATAPHGLADEGPPYPGTCRELSSAQRAERTRSRAPAWRFRAAPGEVTFLDLLQGEQRQDVAQAVGDFVVRRADGVFAYQLAVVVDDASMQITDVLRGADLLTSTARQILLYRALGAPEPRWAHVPLVLGATGERLSKRDGPVSVQVLLERGVSAQRLLGELAQMSGFEAHPTRAARELVADFSLGKLPREGTCWTPRALLGG